MKRLLKKTMALLLVTAMFVNVFPAVAMAKEESSGTITLTPDPIETGSVILDKTGERTGADTWIVTLKVTVKNTNPETELKPSADDAMVDDLIGQYLEPVEIISTEVQNAGGVTYPQARIEREDEEDEPLPFYYVRWDPGEGQSLKSGQTLVIRYSLKLNEKYLPELYGEAGNDHGFGINLNDGASLTYMSDDKTITSSFPEPGDEIELSKLITTVYLNDEAVTEPEPEVRYNIVYNDNSLDLNLPEEETPYVKEGVSYDYSQSTYDNSITTGGAVKLTVGEHYLNHYYYDASTRGAIVYHANGGSFSDGSTDVARSALKPDEYTLWTKDGQGVKPKKQRTWPLHAAEGNRDVVMVGWSLENTAGKVYGKDDPLPALVDQADVAAGQTTDVYAVWKSDKDRTGVPDSEKILVHFEVADGHGVVTPDSVEMQSKDTLNKALQAAQPVVKPEAGWRFTGNWLLKNGDGTVLSGDELLVQQPADGATYVAQVEKDTDPVQRYDVTVIDSYAEKNGAGRYAAGTTVQIDAGQRPGYRFSGWTSDDATLTLVDANSGVTTFTMPERSVTLTAHWQRNDSPGSGGGGGKPPVLNTEDHFSYVVGYPVDYRTGETTSDETLWPVKPQGNITRAEVASIFYRLLKDDVRAAKTTNVSPFSDVSADDWYGTTVATLAEMGIVGGYEDGSFHPNAPISRAEFAAIATRFFEQADVDYNKGLFTDITGDEWYADVVAAAVKLGLLGGYPDGSVQPQASITRAEACAVVNRTLDRRPHEQHLLPVDEMRIWPDNQPGDWYYADMQEATNGHEYEWITDGSRKVEKWTAILPGNTWADR